ncbi:MAG: pyruvate, phosphate dikinase [bacterium]|nr:pyruvate, phosphate dikinase [bacterium]
MTGKKWIYCFGDGVMEGHSDMSELLGNKGANLAEMAAMGLPVPPGFTITTDACRIYLEHGNQLPEEIVEQIQSGIAWLEERSGRSFGDPANPLLVSVRSGAAQSMPGMMDTVLNVGLNDEIVTQLLKTTLSKRFILDCYRRLIAMYGSVVMGLGDQPFDDIIEEFRIQQGLKKDIDIVDTGWAAIVDLFKQAITAKNGIGYPQVINEQFLATIGAVFRSWYSPRAISYRAIQEHKDTGGTAVTVQLMVYGNRSSDSASGVAFSRNPANGEPGLYGEYLPKVQGEDIVDGFHSPRALSENAREQRGDKVASLQTRMPAQFNELVEIAHKLESHFRDMQEIEFTIERGKVYTLQTRAAKRTIEVAIRVALDLLNEGLITKHEAIERVPLKGFHKLTQPILDPDAAKVPITRGLPASPGAASGKIVFSPADAVKQATTGTSVVLVRNETSPNDVAGMNAAAAILTRRGGMTSHAADIARDIGRPCIVDARFIELDLEQKIMKVGHQTFNEGDEITIDGTNGIVLSGRVDLLTPQLNEYGVRFKALLDQ